MVREMGRKIALIGRNLYEGGAEKALAKLSLYLDRKKYEKSIILLDDKNKRYLHDGSVIGLLNDKYSNKFERMLKSWKSLSKIKKDLEIDTSISFGVGMNIINILSRRNEKTIISSRAVESLHIENTWGAIKGNIYKSLIKILYPRADVIVAVSKGVKSDLVSKFGIPDEKIRVIYNFYDINYIKGKAEEPLNQYECIFSDGPVLLNIGRLSRQKGQRYLLGIFKELKKKSPSTKLVIIGNEGDLGKSLYKFSEELGLKTYVEVWDKSLKKINNTYDVYFLCFKENPYRFIKRSSVLLVTSLYEGFPNIIVESLICKTPVVSTDCPAGPKEILLPDKDVLTYITTPEWSRYGALMPPINIKYDVNEWVDVILNIISNCRYSSNSINIIKIMERFSVDKIIPQWEEVINK